MKFLSIFNWFASSMNDFVKQFQNNETLYNQARNYWNQLESYSLIPLVFILFLCGVGFAFYYFKPFNNKPGRHYLPKYWLLFLVVTIAVTFAVSLFCLFLIAHPKLPGSMSLLFKISTMNALFSLILYLIVSFIWFNYLPTNAYRLLKF